jgi:hypothetical protein
MPDNQERARGLCPSPHDPLYGTKHPFSYEPPCICDDIAAALDEKDRAIAAMLKANEDALKVQRAMIKEGQEAAYAQGVLNTEARMERAIAEAEARGAAKAYEAEAARHDFNAKDAMMRGERQYLEDSIEHRDYCLFKAKSLSHPEAERPVKNCGHVGPDGCCQHPGNMTPECHDGACPIAEVRQKKEPCDLCDGEKEVITYGWDTKIPCPSCQPKPQDTEPPTCANCGTEKEYHRDGFCHWPHPMSKKWKDATPTDEGKP